MDRLGSVVIWSAVALTIVALAILFGPVAVTIAAGSLAVLLAIGLALDSLSGAERQKANAPR